MKKISIFFTSFSLLIVLCFSETQATFSDFEHEFSKKREKLAEWNFMASEVSTWCDGLGQPLDEKIKETVIILNLLGFKTRQSCEGHLDWGYSYPGVDFAFDEEKSTELWNELSEVRKKIEGLSEQAWTGWS